MPEYWYQPEANSSVNSKVGEQISRLGKFCIKSGLSDEQRAEYFKRLKNADADILEKIIDDYISENIPSRGMPSIAELFSMYSAADKKTKTIPAKKCPYCQTHSGYIFVERWQNDVLKSTSVCACPHCEAGTQRHEHGKIAYYNPNENYILALASELDFERAKNSESSSGEPVAFNFDEAVSVLADSLSMGVKQ